MLIASSVSSVARAARQNGSAIFVMAPDALSHAGWELDPFRPLDGIADLGPCTVRNDEIGFVVVAIQAVSELDIPEVVARDRPFVAQEMTAFLRTWLTGLGPVVLDPPTPSNLAGRSTDPGVWRRAAENVGIDYVPGQPSALQTLPHERCCRPWRLPRPVLSRAQVGGRGTGR